MELDKLFVSLRDDKARYLNAKKGTDFEERILAYLQMEMGYSRILKSDVDRDDWKFIKDHIGTKLGRDFLNLPDARLKRKVIYSPYGSQMFPDLIVFTENKVVPIEVKFSSKRQSKPIWNSNVPRANAFYIFGSYGLKDVTFFCGDDVLVPKHREFLYAFFNDIRALQDKIRVDMPALDITDRGFTPYIRAAFDQRKHKPTVETSFFTHPHRKEVETLAIKKAGEL
jgi:hypothetical protein